MWAQEEPKNMGAWTYVAPRLRASTGNAIIVRYVGRPERASPAEGYSEAHKAEQERIVAEVLLRCAAVQADTRARSAVTTRSAAVLARNESDMMRAYLLLRRWWRSLRRVFCSRRSAAIRQRCARSRSSGTSRRCW